LVGAFVGIGSVLVGTAIEGGFVGEGVLPSFVVGASVETFVGATAGFFVGA